MDKKIDLSNFQSNSYYEISYLDTESIVDSSFLKNFRKDNNLTQIRLANILGVSKKTIEKWEQGVNPIKGTSSKLLYLLNKEPKLIDLLLLFENDKIDYEEKSININPSQNNKSYYVSYIKKDSIK